MPSLKTAATILLITSTASPMFAFQAGLKRPGRFTSRSSSMLRMASTETDAPAAPKVIPNLDAYDNASMDDIVSLCKRRGFIFPSSEIYNGFAGFYDYGPLGAELKKNVKDIWWKNFVTKREDVVGLDSSIIHNPTTWQSSGMFFLCKKCMIVSNLSKLIISIMTSFE